MNAKEVARAWSEQPPSDNHIDEVLTVLSTTPIYKDVIEEIFFLESERDDE